MIAIFFGNDILDLSRLVEEAIRTIGMPDVKEGNPYIRSRYQEKNRNSKEASL